MLAMIVFIVPSSARSTSEQGASIPVVFQSSVAKPPGIAVMSWCDVVMPRRRGGVAAVHVDDVDRAGAVFWTLSAIMYILLPSQLIWMRLVPLGPVAHQTGAPSES